MAIHWTRAVFGAAVGGISAYALGASAALAATIGVFAFAVLVGRDYTAVSRVHKDDRDKR